MSVISTRDQVPQLARPVPAGVAAWSRGAPASTTGWTGRDLLRILRKRKWLIVLCVALSTALSAGVTALWLFYSPWYTAVARLAVSTEDTSVFGQTGLAPGDVIDRLKNHWAQMAKGETVLNATLDADRVKKLDWFTEHKADPKTFPAPRGHGVSPTRLGPPGFLHHRAGPRRNGRTGERLGGGVRQVRPRNRQPRSQRTGQGPGE